MIKAIARLFRRSQRVCGARLNSLGSGSNTPSAGNWSAGLLSGEHRYAVDPEILLRIL